LSTPSTSFGARNPHHGVAGDHASAALQADQAGVGDGGAQLAFDGGDVDERQALAAVDRRTGDQRPSG
jgi:hypothetical protein